MNEYDITTAYDRIINVIMDGKRQMEQYLAPDKASSCNEILIPMLEKTKTNVHEIIRKLGIVIDCFEYEYDAYAEQDLTDDDKTDKAAIRELRSNLYHIRESFINTNKILFRLINRFEEYDYVDGENVPQAIRNMCKRQNKRCASVWKTCTYEYVFKCMIRPYYIELINNGGSFIQEINKYIPYGKIYDHKEWTTHIRPYIELIAKKAKTRTVYKDVRMREYLESKNKKDIRKTKNAKNKISANKKSYQQQIEQYAAERQRPFNDLRAGKPSPFPSQIIKKMTRSPEYNPDATQCYIVCCVCKEEKKQRYFRYLTKNGLTNRANNVDLFCFTDTEMTDAINLCESQPFVQAVSVIKIL